MTYTHLKKDLMYSEILEYWFLLWKKTSKEVSNGTIGIEIINIRTILLDIVNEYELNKFESDNNRKYILNLLKTK